MVAAYALSSRASRPSSRVARFTPTTSTPVAIGSSVPAWPTLRVPSSRRTRPTTWCEVQPAGLSQMTRPDVSRPARRRHRACTGRAPPRSRRARPARPPGHRSHARRARRSSICRAFSGTASSTNSIVGRELHSQLLADLATDQPGRRGEGDGRAGPVGVRAQHGVEHRRLPAVPRQPHIGHRDESEPGILDPPLQHLGHDHLDLVGQLEHARRSHGLILPRSPTTERFCLA